MLIEKVTRTGISLIVLLKYKIMFGKRLVLKGIRQNLYINTKIVVGKGASLTLGNIGCNSDLNLICTLGVMDIGMASFNRHCIISGRYMIKIGDNCLFGPNVCVYDHDHDYSSEGVLSGFKCSEIIIEDGCWIGAGVIILRGTHIGRNSVIEAGTVVKGDIPPSSLVVADRKIRIIPTSLFMGNKDVLNVQTT